MGLLADYRRAVREHAHSLEEVRRLEHDLKEQQARSLALGSEVDRLEIQLERELRGSSVSPAPVPEGPQEGGDDSGEAPAGTQLKW